MAEAFRLETQRLILRPAALADLPWILEQIDTPAVMRHLGGKERGTEAVTESLLADIAAFDSPDGHQRWTVFLKDETTRMGRVGLFHVRSLCAPATLRGQREIGWMFAAAHWGNGFATEAAAAVLDWAFAARGITVVYSQTSDSNAASTRMMQRLGLARRADCDYVDPEYPARDNPTTVWAIAAADWRGKRG